ncbi:hypothetical protein MAR_012439, partial [Mya arenaria]
SFKNVPNPCTNNPSQQVYFPHPSDNSKFIQCDRYGRMYIIQCPENLLYNGLTSTCSAAATTMAPVAAGSTAGPVVNPPVNTGNTGTNDNTKFIECDMLGHPNVLPCPSGLVWDEGRLSCVYNFNVNVGTGNTGTGGIIVTPATGGTVTGGTGPGTGAGSLANNCSPENIANNKLFWPHPDPTKFIQCDLWGDLYVNSCPAGLVWNQYSETCASAYVNYAGNGGK